MIRSLGVSRLLIFALGTAVATLSACDCDEDFQCTDGADCEGRPWAHPNCTAEVGHWECHDKLCVETCPSECDVASECEARAWPTDAGCDVAEGQWECSGAHVCNAVCNDPCGDDFCDAAAGETSDTCPADCPLPSCTDPIDCTGMVWDVVCDGHWDCQSQTCVHVCDYASCGDTTCDDVLGEDAASCPVDCFDGTCQWPNECSHQSWTSICQGRWTCFMTACQQTCDSNGCGNDTCDGALGESGDSCFTDCGGGPCDVTSDCVRYTWFEGCAGHWSCDAGGGCEAVCDAVDCGDGTCDVPAGEAPDGCATDCANWTCDLSSDCDLLTLPGTCTGWQCVGRVCVPICP